MRKKERIIIFIIVVYPFLLWAQIPAGYYNNAIGKSGYELQVALSNIIDSHRVVGYNELWDYYRLTDLKADNTIWDIYTDPYCSFSSTDHGSVGSGECISYNREHVFCQSWFGYETGAPYSDIHHVYPVDGWINSTRNNNPYGEVMNPTRIFQNGSRFGPNSYASNFEPTPSSNAFEPTPEFKGDIARAFFYMATRYLFEDENFSTTQPMTFRSQLRPWALEMLKNWHILDPVSQKEIDRNNAIYSIQQNRNPYIDYPELVSLIWGNDSLTSQFQLGYVPPTGKPRVIHFAVPTDNSIILTFDTLLVNTSAENSNNYSISGGINIDSINAYNNQVSLHLANPLTIGLPYYIILRNIQSVNGYFIQDTSITFVYGYSEFHTPIISWTFDNISGAPNTPQVIPADFNFTQSAAYLYCDGSHSSSNYITGESGNQLNAYPGTIIGDPRIVNAISGNSLAIVNATANKKSIVLQFSAPYWNDFILTLASRRTQTGFNQHIWEWSLDGVQYDTILGALSVADSIAIFELKTIDLQSIESLNRKDNIFIRITLDGASSNSGNNRFDNITVHAQKCMIHYTIFDSIYTYLPYNENGFSITSRTDTGHFVFTRTGVVEGGCDSLFYLNLHILENPNPPTSISNSSNFSTQLSVLVYPNPSKNLSTIRIEGINDEVIVYLSDISGKTIAVFEKKISSSDNEINIPLQNLSPGMYFTKIHTAKGTVIKKLLVNL